MKIKNKLFLIFALCLAVLFAVSLVACNPTGGGTGSDTPPNNYEVPKYIVTFNTNSDFVLTNSVIRDIPYNTRISEPADANGNKIIPIKKGYTFKYWSSNGSTAFNFSEGIKENTTLTAIYDNNKYYHTPNLRAKLAYDESTETFSIIENARGENEVALSITETGATSHLYSTYAAANSQLPCPTANTTSEGQTNKFCFWYYINSDGKPVQLSKWKAEGDSTVASLSSYYFTEALTVYPMFSDNLPEVTVKYVDSLDADAEPYKTESYTFGQNIAYTKDTMPKPTAKAGYKFEDWYYVVESKDSGGNVKTENNTFVFDDGTENNKPTSPMDASGATDNFTPVVLKLYARWTREITIGDLSDYKALYDEIKGLVNKDEPTEEDIDALDAILGANIIFTANVDFGSEQLEPLFDSKHPFKGTIDGQIKIDETSSRNAVLSGGTFGNTSTASVFGYNEGTIKNLDFSNIVLSITDKTANIAHLGVITTGNAGAIEGCSVTLNPNVEVMGLHSVVFGGVTAFNYGSSSRDGIVKLCTVIINSFVSNCEALTFGGIAGESNASASIANCKATVTITSVKCADDGISKNGRSYLNIGGIVGINASSIRLCSVLGLKVINAESLTEFVFGGIAGANTGTIRTSYAENVQLGSSATPVNVSGSIAFATCVGGLAGKNEGNVLNCYASSELNVAVTSAPQNGSNVFVGGIVGSNYSTKQDSNDNSELGISVITYAYSLGTINVIVDSDINNVNVYVGGIAGRNSHKKVSSLFSTVQINVHNDGDSHLGHMFGKMINNVGTKKGMVFYDSESVIYLLKDGNTYEITGDGKGSEEYVDFENVGNGTDSANFKKSDWVVSTTLGFVGTVWEVGEDSYPSFLDSLYKD